MNENQKNANRFMTTGQYLSKNIAPDGHTVESYTLDLTPKSPTATECENIAQQLQRANVETDFDSENSVRLTLKQINKNLDPILKRNHIVKREPGIGCIVKIYSTILNQIEYRMRQFPMFDMEKNGRIINIFNLKVDLPVATRYLENQFGIKRVGNIGVQFRILGVDNVLESEHIERFHITFAKTYNAGKPREILLPRPHSDLQSFRIWGKSKEDIDPKAQILYDYLSFIYGSRNIETTFLYDFSMPYEATALDFSEQDWACVCQELRQLDFDASAGYTSDSNGRFIYFSFATKAELKSKMEAIAKIRKIDIAKSPLDEDFKFKVKIVACESERYNSWMRKRISELNGKEFICYGANGEKLTVGRLNSADSTPQNLSFLLPYKSRANQDKVKKLMDYISGNPIKEITINNGPAILSINNDDNDKGWLSTIWNMVKESFN